jgi:hypothetical protein
MRTSKPAAIRAKYVYAMPEGVGVAAVELPGTTSPKSQNVVVHFAHYGLLTPQESIFNERYTSAGLCVVLTARSSRGNRGAALKGAKNDTLTVLEDDSSV